MFWGFHYDWFFLELFAFVFFWVGAGVGIGMGAGLPHSSLFKSNGAPRSTLHNELKLPPPVVPRVPRPLAGSYMKKEKETKRQRTWN